jgi:23S rRNA (guanosine2251-2'-O)-methyltransferase
VQRATAQRVKVLAGNGKQDQGVLADVVAPRMKPLALALEEGSVRSVLVLDGITTPANVGMILRTATAAGIDGIVVPRRGVASIDPLVVKASAGVAFRAPVLRCGTAAEASALLRASGFPLYALDSHASDTIYSATFAKRAAFVLGSETSGITDDVRPHITSWLSIPMAAGVESLNVASAAAVLCFELVRRAQSSRSGPRRPGRCSSARRPGTAPAAPRRRRPRRCARPADIPRSNRAPVPARVMQLPWLQSRPQHKRQFFAFSPLSTRLLA